MFLSVLSRPSGEMIIHKFEFNLTSRMMFNICVERAAVEVNSSLLLTTKWKRGKVKKQTFFRENLFCFVLSKSDVWTDNLIGTKDSKQRQALFFKCLLFFSSKCFSTFFSSSRLLLSFSLSAERNPLLMSQFLNLGLKKENKEKI